MKNFLSKFKYLLIGIGLAIAGTVFAVNVTVPQATQKGDLPTGLTSGNYQLLHPGSNGLVLTASSTSPNGLAWQTASSTLATTTINGTLTINSLVDCNGVQFIQSTSHILGCGTPAGGGGFATSTTANGIIISNTSGGAVGINTSTPWANLAVEGKAGSTTLEFGVASSTHQLSFQVGSNGDVAVNSYQGSSNAFSVNNALGASLFKVDATNPATDFLQVQDGAGTVILEVNPNYNVGVNSSTPIATLSVVGSSTVPVLYIASPSGASLFQVTGQGNVNVSTLTASSLVGTDSNKNLNSVAISTFFPASSVSISPTQVAYATGPNIIGGSSNLQWINANNQLLLNNTSVIPNQIIQTSPTSTAVFGNLIQSGGVTAFATSTNLSGSAFCGTGLSYVNSGSAFTTNIKFPDLFTVASAPCGPNVWASAFAQQFLYVASSSPVVVSPSGTGETLLYAPGSSATVYSGQVQNAIGQFIASSTIAGANTPGMTFQAYLQTFQPRATGPTMTGQFLMASTTASGSNGEWLVGNIIAGANITVTTSTPGQITIASTASGGGGGGVATTTPFSNGKVPFASGTIPSLTDSPIFTNGTVVGINASSATASLLVQGTTTLNPFQITSSTGVNLLRVSANGSLGLGTTTNASTLFVQGTSTLPTLPLLTVASSSGATVFQINNDGTSLFQSTATSSTSFVINNPSGNAVWTLDNTPPSAGQNILVLQNSASQILFSVDSNGAVIASTTVSALAFLGKGSAPTIASSTGIGATCGAVNCQFTSINSSNSDGFVSFNTGSAPTVNATILTLTFAQGGFTNAPNCVLFNGTSTPAFLPNIYSTTTATTLVVKNTTTALAAAANYAFYYSCPSN